MYKEIEKICKEFKKFGDYYKKFDEDLRQFIGSGLAFFCATGV